MIKKSVFISMAAALMISGILFADSVKPDAAIVKPVEIKPAVPRIQMAILLDTSGSMSGLINQARTELWAVVNEFITVKRDGMAPQLDVALYEYGKSGLPSKGGYIRQIVPFTNDLDKISKELFALKTSGGSEYCGWVIKDAVNQLKWSKAPDDLKVVFIAGNEAFTQGPIDYKESCKAAIKKGIIVNTIHCGSMSAGVSGKWKNGAVLSDGKYLCINHNQRAVEIKAPQDAELVKLNSELNGTYIAYGARGRQLKENQIAQDMNSSSISSSNMASRVATKSSKFYYNGSWDIVDALEANKIDLGKMKKKDLPKEMREMDEKERNEYVAENAKKRKELQAKIQKLNDARKSYIAKEMKKRTGEDSSLGAAIIKAVRKQAEKRSFIFEEAKKEEKPEK